MIVHFLMKSSEIRIKSRNFREKSDRIKMIVLCEIGWPQKSPWVRMIWMISCSETIKINSKTWLRFYLIIKPNISFWTIFSFFAFIWFIFENSIKMMPSWHSWIRFTVGLPVTCRFCATKLPRQPFHWWNCNIGTAVGMYKHVESDDGEDGDVPRSSGSNWHSSVTEFEDMVQREHPPPRSCKNFTWSKLQTRFFCLW